MHVEPGDYVIGILVVISGAVGVLLALHALDLEMEVFGLSLAGFAVAFLLGQVRRCRATAGVQRHD
jgi:hypothetical protein